MTYYECDKTMKCLGLMVADLNDAHNDFDKSTHDEDAMKCELKQAITQFNAEQDYWRAELKPTKTGWGIKYV